MTERWQRELQKLRYLEPPSTAWPRVEQRPRGDGPQPSGRGRVVAGVVAFAVFAAAGVFAWRAFSGRPTIAGRVGPSEGVVRIDLAAGTEGDLAAVLRSGTAEASGVRFPVEVFSTGGSLFNTADFVATFPPPTFAPIPSDANFRLTGGVERGTVDVWLIGAEVVEAGPKHLVPSRNLTQGDGDLAWDLDGVSLSQGPPLTVEPGRQYMLAVLGRTVAGEEFGFSFGIQIERETSVSEPTATPRDAVNIPDVAQVRCTDAGTELLTPVVRPQADGVHLQVESLASATAISARTPETSPPESGLIAEFGAHTGGGTLVLAIAPSRYLVTCVRDRGEDLRVDPATEKPLDVVDADGHWFPDRLACSDGRRRYTLGSDKNRRFSDEEQLIRTIVPGIRATDVIGPAGYPEATRGQEWDWRIEREGKVLALLNVADEGIDVAIVDACSGSGIGEGN